jgi:phosphoribosylamine-glycine ligase
MMSKDDRGAPFAKMKVPSSHFQGHNIWILKATGFNRGRGIHVFNKLEELNKLIKEYTDGANGEAAIN